MTTKTSGSNSSGGIGFFGLLGLVFITLKLTGYIAWTWAWVLSPLWIPICVVLASLLIWFVGFLVFELYKAVRK